VKAVLAPNGRPARLDLPRIRARYEGAIPSRKRGYVPEQIDDTETWDLQPNSYQLNEICRISLYLYKNAPLIHGVVERFVTDIIGCGIMPIPGSSEIEWNRKAKKRWRKASKYLQINNRDGLGVTQRKIVRHQLLEGNIFVLLIEDDDSNPSIQLIRQHRLLRIERNKFGRPTRYVFRITKNKETSEKPYNAEDVIHFKNSIFADGLMGEPLMASALNTARDMGEIVEFEKIAVKDASSKKDIIKTASGEMDVESMLSTGGETLNGSDGLDAAKYYRERWEPETMVLRSGDEWSAYEPKRPGPAWQGFMEFLAQSICLSVNYPPATMLGTKLGGADSRRDLATAQRTIEPMQEDFAGDFRRVYVHQLAPGTLDGGELSPAPEDWTTVRWQFPKPKTADYGREAQQDREDVREGLLTREEYWARQYQDPEEQDAQIVAEAVDRKNRIDAAGLSLDEFRTLLDLHSNATPAADVEPMKDQDGDGELDDSKIVQQDTGLATDDVAKLALNGAQLAAVQEFLTQVSLKQLPGDAAKLALQIALPATDVALINRMVDSAVAFNPKPEEPTSQPNPQEVFNA
jgi:capsid protein